MPTKGLADLLPNLCHLIHGNTEVQRLKSLSWICDSMWNFGITGMWAAESLGKSLAFWWFVMSTISTYIYIIYIYIHIYFSIVLKAKKRFFLDLFSTSAHSGLPLMLKIFSPGVVVGVLVEPSWNWTMWCAQLGFGAVLRSKWVRFRKYSRMAD